MSRRRTLLALGLGALALAAAGGAAWRFTAGPSLPAYAVQRVDLLQTVVASGRVESPRRVEVGVAMTGTVVEVAAEEGAAVRAGQLLLRLDDAELSAALSQARHVAAQAEARVGQRRTTALPVSEQAARQAETQLANAERALARSRELFAKGFVGQAALDEAQRGRDVALSQREAARVQRESLADGGSESRLEHEALAAARAAVALAQARLALATVVSPVDATVLTRSVERGGVAQPGRALLVLSPRGDTQVVAQIDEKNLPLLALGQEALVSADAYPERRFEARVLSIHPAIDPLRGSVEVKLAVPQPPPYLLQDMTVTVDIRAAVRPAVLAMPADALRPGDWVYAVRDGRAVRQPVRLGARARGQVEVVDGLREGERILPAAGVSVREGQAVRVRQTPAKSP